MAKQRLDSITRKAMEQALADSHDAKGFLGSAALNAVVNEIAAECYQHFLTLEQPGQLLAVTMRAQVLEDIYQRIVKKAQSGDTAASILANSIEE